MKAADTKGRSETDWAKVDALADEDVDISEGFLDEVSFEAARWRLPKEQTVVPLQVDDDVLAWFQTQEDYKAKMNAALRLYAEVHKDVRKG